MQQITVLSGQNIVDIALQYLGSTEAVLELAQINNISITARVQVGQVLLLPAARNKAIKQYFEQIEQAVASGELVAAGGFNAGFNQDFE